MSATRPPKPKRSLPAIDGNATPSRSSRSRVGNGSALLPDVDGRSASMRRYKDVLASLVKDMGGDPSEAQTIIVRRAATLAVWCEEREAAMARGETFDIAGFTTATNALRRLLSDIGLERRAKDITPSIRDYMRRTRAADPAVLVQP